MKTPEIWFQTTGEQLLRNFLRRALEMSKSVQRDRGRETRRKINDLIEQKCHNCTAIKGLRWGRQEMLAVCNNCEHGQELQRLSKPLWEVSEERMRRSVGEWHIEPMKEVKKPMAPRTKERGKVVPVKNIQVESTGGGAGPVKKYQMSEEELEDLRARTGYTPPKEPNGSGGQKMMPSPDLSSEKQSERAHKRHDGRTKEGPNGKTKEEFLQGIASGKTISALERDWGMKPGTLSFWVGRWNLRGIMPGRAREMLSTGSEEKTAGTEQQAWSKDEWQPTGEDYYKVCQELEQQRQRADKAEADLQLTKECYDEAIQILNETKLRLNEAEEKLAATEAAAMVLHNRQAECAVSAPDPEYPFPVVTLTYGLIDFGVSRSVQLEKCKEEGNEYLEELVGSVDIQRASSELYDAGQAFVGLIRKQFEELLVDDPDESVRRYFEKQNRLHLEKMSRKVSGQ